MTADRDALVKAAQDVIDRWYTPLWKDAPATALYIARLRDALTAPAEAPVAWRWKYRGGNYWHFATDKPKFAAPESYFIVDPLYAAPLPQSAPVSREAVIDEVTKGLNGKAFVCHTHDDFGKGRERGLLDAVEYCHSLAAHPAEPAGKGE